MGGRSGVGVRCRVRDPGVDRLQRTRTVGVIRTGPGAGLCRPHRAWMLAGRAGADWLFEDPGMTARAPCARPDARLRALALHLAGETGAETVSVMHAFVLASTRRAGFALALALVALGGCTRHASPPPGYESDRRSGCPDLAGDYRIASSNDVVAWMPVPEAEGVTDWSTLSIEPGQFGKGLRLVLRRDPLRVQQEATALRGRSPGDYTRWHEQVRYAMELDRGKPGVGYGEGILRRHGPAVQVVRELRVPGDCEGGWAPVSHAGSHTWLARGKGGELLMQIRRYRNEATGWSFFGTQVTRPRYERSDWYRLSRVAPGTPVRFDAASLPPAPGPESARRRRVPEIDAELATRELAAEAEALLRRSLPRGVRVSLLRRTQFDPAALALAPGAVRMEIAGTFSARLDPDPLQELLRAIKRVDSIELRERSQRSDGRAYVLVRFTWHAGEAPGR